MYNKCHRIKFLKIMYNIKEMLLTSIYTNDYTLAVYDNRLGNLCYL